MNLKIDMLNERKAQTKIKQKEYILHDSQNRLIYNDRKQISSCLGTGLDWEDNKGVRGNF